MRFFILTVFTLLINYSFSQEKASDRIKFLKAKKVSKIFNARAHTQIRDKTAKRVMVRCRITPLDQEFDINSFSLVDMTNKLRYRISDISAYYAFGGPRIQEYYTQKPLDKEGNEIKTFYAKYDPMAKDTFLEYEFEGYKLCETKFCFSSGQRISTYYGVARGKKKFTVDLYFVMDKELLKEKGYALFFGNEKIRNVAF